MKQFKNLILAGALVVGLAGFAVSCNKYGDDIEEIRNELASLRTGQVATVESQLASLQGTVSSLTSAKDALQSTVSGLESQLNALKNSAASAEDVAAVEAQIAALEADIAALKAADAALEAKIAEINKTLETFVTLDDLDATLASYATVKEVAEAVAEVQAALDKYVKSNDETVAAEVAKLEAAIAKAQEEAVAAAGKAFEAAFQTSFDAAVTAAGLVDATKLNAEIEAYDAKIKAYIAAAIENGGKVDEEIGGQISEAITDLKKFVANRLTSVTLIPETYVDGIETIMINTMEYPSKKVVPGAKNAQGLIETETIDYERNEKNAIIYYNFGLGNTDVRYHVSPSKLMQADIEAPTFVYESAVATRAAIKDELLVINGYKVENGELIVSVKGSDISLPYASGTRYSYMPSYLYVDGVEYYYDYGQKCYVDEEGNPSNVMPNYVTSNRISEDIVTAALRVPIAEKNLAEGESDAVVYSDYARLVQSATSLHIAALIDHYSKGKETDGKYMDFVKEGNSVWGDYYYAFASSFSSAKNWGSSNELLYNEEYDLLEMVTGCNQTDRKEITKEELAKYGVEFRFAIPEVYYSLGNNNTNEQAFAKIEGTKIIATLPDGTTKNAAATNRTPIVRVELVDTNNDKIIDIRYFKIQWVDKKVTTDPIDPFEFEFNYVLNCNNFSGEINWSDFNTKILAKIGENGMSYSDFQNSYDIWNGKVQLEGDKEDEFSGIYTTDSSAPNFDVMFKPDWSSDVHTAAVTWKVTPGALGTVIDPISHELVVKSKSVTVIIPGRNNRADIVLKLKVNISLPTLATMNGYNSTFWEDNALGSLARVFPVQYNTPGAAATAIYNHDFHRLFADNQVLKGMFPCGTWDIQFAHNQTAVGSYLYQATDGSFKVDSYVYGGAMTDPWMNTGSEGYLLKASTVGVPGAPSLFPGSNAKFGTAAQFVFNGMGSRWYAAESKPLKNNQPEQAATHKSIESNIKLQVTESEQGISILSPITEKDGKVVFVNGKDKKYTINVWAALNEYNPYLVSSFEVRFAAPLYLKPLALNNFTDQIISGSVVSFKDKLEVYDFAKYLVVGKGSTTDELKKYTAQLQDYYQVEGVVLSEDNAAIMTNLKKDANGSYVAVKGMNPDEATVSVADYFGVGAIAIDATKQEITFKNVAGNKVESEVELYFPVSIKHKWGILTDWVTIKVQANTINK